MQAQYPGVVTHGEPFGITHLQTKQLGIAAGIVPVV